MRFCSFYFEQFFLDRLVANIMMRSTDVCLMLDCFLFEKFYLHYVLCDFDFILRHCTKLFICRSIDCVQIFDVTFDPPPLKNPAYATVFTFLSRFVIFAFNVLSYNANLTKIWERG